jgi:hypothetical protein
MCETAQCYVEHTAYFYKFLVEKDFDENEGEGWLK